MLEEIIPEEITFNTRQVIHQEFGINVGLEEVISQKCIG